MSKLRSGAVDLPLGLTLPSKLRVTLTSTRTSEAKIPERDPAAPIFADVLELFDSGVVSIERDVRDLILADFHVIRAVLTKAKLLEEEEVELTCHNCEELLVALPCEGLEIGPYKDGELDDPELDRLADRDVPLDLPIPIALGRVRQARTITLKQVTVREALPLFDALAKDPFTIDEGVVNALGIGAIGAISEPKRLARILTECDDETFASITEAFLVAHYPLRLACDVFCTKCKARNTIDAPALREFELFPTRNESDDDDTARPFPPLPSLEEFVELAHRIADPLIAQIPGEKAELIVEDGTPAVDDGGEPLLGSYVPPPPKDAPVATRPPTVTVYYRTFVAIEEDEGAAGTFDWEDELRETIEHELEHHVFFLRGDDPMDEEEHAEIDREAVRVVGRAEATRRTLAVFGTSIPDFFRRAWPLVLIAAAVLAITLAEGRCSSSQ